jgi:hypothetical protein
MTRVEPMNGEGSICATVRKMSIDEADECARSMVGLYRDIMRYTDKAQEALSLQTRGQPRAQPAVPPFLVKPSRRARSG